MAARVGSDVPLFLVGGTVLGQDRGQMVMPVPEIEATWCVVAIPALGVSTPQAFRDWDALCERTGLTPEASEAKLNELSRVYASVLSGANSFIGLKVRNGSSGVSPIEGDLAGPQVSRACPHRDSERLRTSCLSATSPSKRDQAYPCGFGHSGGSPPCLVVWIRFSTLWALPSPGRSRSSRHRLRARGVQSLLTRTLPRRAYWRQMLLK